MHCWAHTKLREIPGGGEGGRKGEGEVREVGEGGRGVKEMEKQAETTADYKHT